MTDHDAVASLLRDSEARIRASSSVTNDSRHIIRMTQETILQSRRIIADTDVLLRRMPLAAPGLGYPVLSAVSLTRHRLETITGRLFHDVVLSLDGRHFISCVITGCVLEYSGQPLILEATSFLGCSFRLQGDTASTFDLVDCFKSMPGDAATYSMDATKSFLQKDPKGLH